MMFRKSLYVLSMLVAVITLISCSDAAKQSTIDTSFIQLASPINGSKLFQTDIALSWGDTDESSQFGYRVQVASDPEFNTVVIDRQLIERSTLLVVDNTIPVHELYWRVSKIKNDNTLGDWTATWKVTIVLNSVGLTTPIASEKINQTLPTFQWLSNEFAQSYLFRLFRDAELTQLHYSTEVVANEVVLPASNILPQSASQAYYWQVTPIIDGVHGNVSDTEVFIIDTVAPDILTLNKVGGPYNIETQFDVVTITTPLETGASMLYTMSTDGSEPVDPTPNAAQVYDGVGIAGINQNGQTIIKYVQLDEAGNMSGLTRVDYTMDIIPPANITAAQANGMYNATTAFNQLTINGIETGGLAYYELSTDGTVPNAPTEQSASITSVVNVINNINQNAITQIKIMPVDGFGNPGQILELNYNIDTTAPELTSVLINGNSASTYLETVSVTLQALDASDFSEYQVLDPNSNANAQWFPFRPNFQHTSHAFSNINDATISLQVLVKDTHGNISAPVSDSINLHRTIINSNITNTTNWDNQGEPYLVRSDFQIDAAAALTISGPARIIFLQETNIDVLGSMNMNGVQGKIEFHIEGLFLNMQFSNPDPASSVILNSIFSSSTNATLNIIPISADFSISESVFIGVNFNFAGSNLSMVRTPFIDALLTVADAAQLLDVVLNNSDAVIPILNMNGGIVTGTSHLACFDCSIAKSTFDGFGADREAIYVRDILVMDGSTLNNYRVGILIDNISQLPSAINNATFSNMQDFYITNLSQQAVTITNTSFDGDHIAKTQGPMNFVSVLP